MKANIEGGQYFNWYYNDGNNLGIGLDPHGTDLRVSLPQGDRLAQSRNAYSPNQQILAPKQLRWWWNNTHQAVYDNDDGTGWQPHGPATEWNAQSKSIAFAEYGFASCDRATNQPNVFFNPASMQSNSAYWSIWDPNPSTPSGYAPRPDDLLQTLALEAVYEYWVTDGNNAVSTSGVPMIQAAFMSAWNWDARPFPVFPNAASVWNDADAWPAGFWIGGKGPVVAPPVGDSPPALGPFAVFPPLPAPAWSVRLSPRFSLTEALHVSGREVRASRMTAPLWTVELTYDLLRMAAPHADLQTIVGFFEQRTGEGDAFYFEPPLSPAAGQSLGTGDGVTTTFSFVVSIGGATLSPACVGAVSAIYLNGVVQSGGYTITIAPLSCSVGFAAAPAPGTAVSADFHWYLLCRFADDDLNAEEFMAQLYALPALQLQTVRP